MMSFMGASFLNPARRAACLSNLPLEGAGRVLGFVRRLMLPCRPVELHPLGQLLLTAVFENLSGFKIDLHGVPFPAREARRWGLSWGLKKKKPLLRFFSEGCVLQRCTCGRLCSPLSARSCPDAGE